MLSLNQHKVEMLVDEGYSVFVTGKGGSGKSFFLRNIIEKLRRSGDHCFVKRLLGLRPQISVDRRFIHSLGSGLVQSQLTN